MTKSEIIPRLLDPGIIAILRADSSDQLVSVVEALVDGGITAAEVTMTTPNALQVITEVTARFGAKVLMGVGSVLDPETCRAARKNHPVLKCSAHKPATDTPRSSSHVTVAS